MSGLQVSIHHTVHHQPVIIAFMLSRSLILFFAHHSASRPIAVRLCFGQAHPDWLMLDRLYGNRFAWPMHKHLPTSLHQMYMSMLMLGALQVDCCCMLTAVSSMVRAPLKRSCKQANVYGEGPVNSCAKVGRNGFEAYVSCLFT